MIMGIIIAYFGTFLLAQMVKNLACHAEDPGSIPGLGRSPGEGNGNPLQYSCLENSMDRGAWWATVHGVANSWTRLTMTNTRIHTHTHTLTAPGEETDEG